MNMQDLHTHAIARSLDRSLHETSLSQDDVEPLLVFRGRRRRRRDSLGLYQHPVQCPDVVLGDLYGLELAQLPVVAVLGEDRPQGVEGRVELSHPLSLAVVGVGSLLLLLGLGQLLWTGTSLLVRTEDDPGTGKGRGRTGTIATNEVILNYVNLLKFKTV